jgi:hypothetical protein
MGELRVRRRVFFVAATRPAAFLEGWGVAGVFFGTVLLSPDPFRGIDLPRLRVPGVAARRHRP